MSEVRPLRRSWWSRLRIPVLVLAVSLAGAAAVTLSREYVHGHRFVRDDIDRGAYYDRGSFVLTPGARPYRDVFSEYPQLATYLFALPHLPALPRGLAQKTYMDVFTALMALALFALAVVWRALARDLGVDERRGLLLLLPGTLYFTLNRYDVVPALFSLCAIALLLRRRVVLAHSVLAVAVLMKAYPLTYLPLFAAFSLRRWGWRKALAGVAASGAVLVAFSVQLGLWSGWTSVAAPYLWQLGRDYNFESLYYLLSRRSAALQAALKPTFLLIQAALPAVAAVLRPASARALVRWATAITIVFVLFTRFQSPQWVIWITPLALLGAATPAETALAVAQDVLAYVYFPLVFDSSLGALALPLTLWVLTLVRLALAGLLLRDPEQILTRRRAAEAPPAARACGAPEASEAGSRVASAGGARGHS